MDDRKYRLSLVAVFETAVILRIWGLGQLQLWYDECFTLLAAKQDIPTMIRATMTDVHPPLLYLIQWVLVHIFGEINWVMRLPSALASIAVLFLTWKLGERLGISREGIIAALLFLTVNTVQLWYAQEARMYAILQMLVMVAVLAIFFRRWWVLGIANVALLWLHNYALFYLPVMACMALWELRFELKDKALLFRLSLAFIIPALLWLPWAFVLLNQMTMVAGGYWIAPI